MSRQFQECDAMTGRSYLLYRAHHKHSYHRRGLLDLEIKCQPGDFVEGSL